jgi:DNA topoisomerase-1
VAKIAEKVYLAPDPDREGEAIAWHLAQALALQDPQRVTFTEITEKAVKAALENPRPLDINLVRAQEARRGLDRLVGYTVSPELTRLLGSPLSAGRVQSPALNLVAEREQGVRDFKSSTHLGVELTFEAVDGVTDGWKAQWDSRPWLPEGLEYFQDQDMAGKIATLKNLTVTSYQENESRVAPPAPFTTSTLQQAASNRLKFSPKTTMELAQSLYESGSITYMRTDSPNLSEEAIAAIRSLAVEKGWPLPSQPRTWKSKEGAQEAHEAIRPTHFEVEDTGRSEAEKKLYRLIRLQALASQLAEAVYAVATTSLEGEIDQKTVTFTAKGRRLIQPGWRVLFGSTDDDEEDEPSNPLPKLREGAQAVPVNGQVLVKKTKAPARWNEAGLIRELEKRGLGRPSTYAAILDNITSRGYVKVEQSRLVPTPLGEKIIKLLAGRFSFLDYEFTRQMEARLDEIAAGHGDYLAVLRETYDTLGREMEEFRRIHSHPCPKCGKPLRRFIRKDSDKSLKGYDFWSCSGYPECKASYPNQDDRPYFGPPIKAAA